MKADGILNADMATLGRWLRAGLSWWLDELAALVPARWRAREGTRGPMLLYDGSGGLFRFQQGRRGDAVEPGQGPRRATALLPARLCLVRTVERPIVGDRDLQRMLALEADRIMPFPGEAMLIAARAVDRRPQEGRMTVEVAALPRSHAADLAARMEAAGVAATRVGLVDGAGAASFDFLPAMRAAGLAAGQGSAATPWWMLVGFLFLLNLGALIWRDTASTDRLAELVEAQRPAVSATQRVAQRIGRFDALVRQSASRRERHDALGLLAVVSGTLPDGAWVQRLSWDGRSLRLMGYKRREDNVVSALRRAPILGDVRNTTSDAVAEVPAGQPFDVSARIRGG